MSIYFFLPGQFSVFLPATLLLSPLYRTTPLPLSVRLLQNVSDFTPVPEGSLWPEPGQRKHHTPWLQWLARVRPCDLTGGSKIQLWDFDWNYWKQTTSLSKGRKGGGNVWAPGIQQRFQPVICSCCDSKIPETGWLTDNRYLYLTVLEAGSPRSKCQQIQCLAHFLIHSLCLLTASSHGGRGQDSLWSLFYKALIPFMTEAPEANTIMWGIRRSV